MIAAGTGLGEAGLIWNGERYHAVATEGSHSDFGPRSALQVDLYTFLARDSHVSYEDVCSGIGLVTLYRFLRERSHTEEPAWLAGAIRDGDAAAAISSAGLTGRDPVCAQALDLMVSIYGGRGGQSRPQASRYRRHLRRRRDRAAHPAQVAAALVPRLAHSQGPV